MSFNWYFRRIRSHGALVASGKRKNMKYQKKYAVGKAWALRSPTQKFNFTVAFTTFLSLISCKAYVRYRKVIFVLYSTAELNYWVCRWCLFTHVNFRFLPKRKERSVHSRIGSLNSFSFFDPTCVTWYAINEIRAFAK